jgi:hypothetical protein
MSASDTTTIRIDRSTHQELLQLTRNRQQTITELVARAVRVLRQDEMGRALAAPLNEDEVSWLDADAG